MNGKKLPVTIFTGFLGSGKTTLLARVLQNDKMKDTAVLVNEFGKVGLDHHLLERIDENTILLGGGCVCCTTRDDLVKALMELLDKVQKGEISRLDRVVVETTGLADPAPILFTILTHPVLMHHFFIDNVIVTVDAVNGLFHLEKQPESLKQAAVADKIIVTKTDIATAETVSEVSAKLSYLNPSAEIIQASFGEVDLALLFNSNKTKVVDIEKISEAIRINSHPNETRSVSMTFDKPLDWTAFGLWLSMLLHARGEDVLRVKGLIDVGEQGPVVLHGVQHIIHPPDHLTNWPDEDYRSKIIFIMRTIEPKDVLDSLYAFQHVIGAHPNLLEMEALFS